MSNGLFSVIKANEWPFGIESYVCQLDYVILTSIFSLITSSTLIVQVAWLITYNCEPVVCVFVLYIQYNPKLLTGTLENMPWYVVITVLTNKTFLDFANEMLKYLFYLFLT